jgi:4-hydroxyproline epimerase
LASGTSEKLCLTNVDRLTDVTWRIRQALVEQGITGTAGAEIDHIELFGPPQTAGADSKNFVLCPGKAYDRSPCGTGTSAKIACLVSDGKLQPEQVWRQESIVGSLFEAYASIEGASMERASVESASNDGVAIIPHIRGSAYVTAESTLVIDPRDPLGNGIGTFGSGIRA